MSSLLSKNLLNEIMESIFSETSARLAEYKANE